MKKGMNVWSLPSELSLKEQFAVTKQAGFDTIELNLSEADSQHTIVSDELGLAEKTDLSLTSDASVLESIKGFSQHYQLPISSISTSLHWKYPLTSPDLNIRNKGKSIVRKMIDCCKYLGGDTVLVVPGLVTAETTYDDCYQQAALALKELAGYAEEQRIIIGIENVWNKFLLSPLEMRQFLDEINSPYVKAYFDVGNVLQYGYPEQWIAILGERIAKIHVKDFKQQIGSIQGFTSLLQGNVPWSEVMEALRNAGYQGPLTCELAPYTQNGQQLAADTSAALDYILTL